MENFGVIKNVNDAKFNAGKYLSKNGFELESISYGLPEIIDRYKMWNVPILFENFNIGEIAMNIDNGNIKKDMSSDLIVLNLRIEQIKKYKVRTKDQLKKIIDKYLKRLKIDKFIIYSTDDISLKKSQGVEHKWIVSLKNNNNFHIGDIYINAELGNIDTKNSIDKSILVKRAKGNIDSNRAYAVSPLNNMILKGKCQNVLRKLPYESVDLIFTSPPYYNARKQYSEYNTYEEYLEMMRSVIRAGKRVLMEGKFFIMNTSHVLIPRASRSESSKRIGVPFDLHQIFIEEGFEFVDDIIWQKPEGAGWASGRGRRFSADRNAMQYKAVPVTEYVMVYRKKSKKLIDFFIRNHPNPELVEESKILGDYEKTNVWYISPARDKRHPAIFPKELAKNIIKYYSFKGDVVLDIFAGIGTTAKAAIELERKFCMIECSDEYIQHMISDIEGYNDLTNNINYEYRDYSDIEEIAITDDKESNAVEFVKLLLKKGVQDTEIIKLLQKNLNEKSE
ncbi:DNA-methyltransferase [Clostridium perfringens]|uniref:DNA-methyltransferase n=1 Tax=Clostridium perfringens TaxID=1502 RepID=UPI003A4C24BF